MDFSPYLGFAGIALTLALTPGADWAYSIAAGLRPGSPAPSVAGLCSGYVLHTVLVSAGFGLLLAARPELVSWLSLAGAAYLLWLGVSTVRSWRTVRLSADAPNGQAPVLPGDLAGATAPRSVREFLMGLGTSGINPKGILLYAAIMPQFIRLTSPLPVAAQTTVMGLSHVAISMLVYGVVAFAARRLLSSRPRLAQRVTLTSGILMLVIAVVLVVEQAEHLLA
ncbi:MULTISPECIES: LysE family translocator [Arthrobacter]|uniref:LysE family translocator n=2 Tax=Arthrobacter TaxID=1663 RepID=A0ABU9KJT1_9MICC|nr:LysE family translocator [Arthrobacter sp. YJM1]MDP5227178.1 LysE family translocator [Arthrobacter sp. YJM1]